MKDKIPQHKRMALGQSVPQGKGVKQLAKGGPFSSATPAKSCGCGGVAKKAGKYWRASKSPGPPTR